MIHYMTKGIQNKRKRFFYLDFSLLATHKSQHKQKKLTTTANFYSRVPLELLGLIIFHLNHNQGLQRLL